ncbi:MAG: helix-turn-helix domain-containing protein [Myxococcota bacterium]
MEKRYLQAVWEQFGGDITALAKHMDVHRKSVYRLLREHGFID